MVNPSSLRFPATLPIAAAIDAGAAPAVPLAADVAAQTAGATDANADQARKAEVERKKMEQEVYQFTFDWTSPNGKRWHGEFSNKVLDVRARQERGILQASFGAGLVLDDATAELNQAVAHLSKSLVQRPKWADNLQSVQDWRVVLLLWEYALNHETVFFRP